MFKKVLLGFGLVSAVAFSVYQFSKPTHEKLPIIAMTQVIEHTTLDTVRKGLLEGLKDHGYEDGKNIRIIYQNAHGQMPTAAQIGQHFATLDPAVFVALSTQSAQLLLPLHQQKNIPLVFTAVTDVLAARLVSDLDNPPPGLLGISDFMDPAPQITMLKSLVPHLKHLGILHNPSEINSTLYLQKFEAECIKHGISVVRSPLNNTSEAVSATRKLLGKVDAIYFPNDNTTMAAVSSIVNIAHNAPQNLRTPVFANDRASVEQGCVAALGYDRIAMGRDTADLVIKALKGDVKHSIPIKIGSRIDTIVNESALKLFSHLTSPTGDNVIRV